jgi:hypothetical protein
MTHEIVHQLQQSMKSPPNRNNSSLQHSSVRSVPEPQEKRGVRDFQQADCEYSMHSSFLHTPPSGATPPKIQKKETNDVVFRNIRDIRANPITAIGNTDEGNFIVQKADEKNKKTTIHAGNLKKIYENDMISGGAETVKVQLETFWEYWQRSQRDENIHEPAVKEYEKFIDAQGGINAPFVEYIEINSSGDGIEIRTGEGRHRIHAAHRRSVTHIYILRPSKTAIELTEVFGLKSALFPDL